MKLVPMLTICALLFGCDATEKEASVESISQKWQEFTEELETYGKQEASKIVDKVQDQLAELDSDIEQLKVELSQQTQNLSEELVKQKKKALELLEQQKSVLQNWHQEFKESPVEALDLALDKLTDQYQQVKEQLLN